MSSNPAILPETYAVYLDLCQMNLREEAEHSTLLEGWEIWVDRKARETFEYTVEQGAKGKQVQKRDYVYLLKQK